jgi:3-oxoadipate enol-lactonase
VLIDTEETGSINVVRAGPQGAPPLLFLHPVGLDLTWWGDQFARFGGDYDVIALDMPGHGLSASFDGAPTFARLARMVEGVIGTLQIAPAHIVGLSVGGMIAQTLALKRPDLVRSLSLVGTLCTFPEPVRAALRDRAHTARHEGMARIALLANERWFTASFRQRRPDILDRATQSLLRQDSEAHAAIWDMIADLDILAEIGDITCPTLVVTGEADINAPPAAAKMIGDAIRGSSVEIMPGIGHFPPFEAPADFNGLLDAFLRKATRP